MVGHRAGFISGIRSQEGRLQDFPVISAVIGINRQLEGSVLFATYLAESHVGIKICVFPFRKTVGGASGSVYETSFTADFRLVALIGICSIVTEIRTKVEPDLACFLLEFHVGGQPVSIGFTDVFRCG